jgi:uncharacterized membrane protein YccC
LRRDAAEAAAALAELLDADLADDPDRVESRAHAAGQAVAGLRRSYLMAPHRPTGPIGPMAALASLVDELDWLKSFLAPAPGFSSVVLRRPEDAEALAATAGVLRASAATLTGSEERPDFRRLDAARDAVAEELARRISASPASSDDELLGSALEPTFRIRAASYSARQVAGYSLLASGRPAPELDEMDVAGGDVTVRPARAAVEATERLATEHAGGGSIWLRNSLRGAAGLAVAVFIAQRGGLQHSFWVVLGTISVLRSNALGTGWSVLTALVGTAVGILIGAGLVIAIGTHEAVLWVVLPFAVLLAAYAPRAISFAAGQAGFTVVLFILFNIIQPSGWRVGVVRLEDVAIGFAISLGVGLLFWPRGAAALLRENLAAAYGRSADYVVATTREIIDEADSGSSAELAQTADTALHRLDDAFRQYLSERSATSVRLEEVAGLVAGAARVRRAGQSLSMLGRMTDDTRLTRCGANLDGEIYAVRSWYVTLGDSFVHSTAIPPPHIRDAQGRAQLLECVRAAVSSGDGANARSALVLLWANQHLDALWRLESHLGKLAEQAARPAEAEPA